MACLAAAAFLSACGDEPRQDAEEPEERYELAVIEQSFPERQRLAETVDLQLAIENVSEATLPALVVTIRTDDQPSDEAFNVRSDQPGLADPNRPVWILEQNFPKVVEPGVDFHELTREPTAGAETAQENTFDFGSMAPGEVKTLAWRVTPVVPGEHTVTYELAAGLHGNALAIGPDGEPVGGEFEVSISAQPPAVAVDDQGNVVPARQQRPEGRSRQPVSR